jgi:hypothetical protein
MDHTLHLMVWDGKFSNSRQFNLCKNNYYYTLASEYAPNPPPTILPSHTGILVDSGACSFYFASGAPVTNYNPQTPTVGVSVANGRHEHSVASATLASASSLPQAAMSGHVMPSFPHTLIGLGPFADQGCNIVFTKTAVTATTLMDILLVCPWSGSFL